MNRIISFCKQYKHALLPILYAPVYLLIFFYLEKNLFRRSMLLK